MHIIHTCIATRSTGPARTTGRARGGGAHSARGAGSDTCTNLKIHEKVMVPLIGIRPLFVFLFVYCTTLDVYNVLA